MQFGVLGILCRFFTAYFIINHLNVNVSILIIWIREGSDFVLLHVPMRSLFGVFFFFLLVLGQAVLLAHQSR